MQLEPIGVVRSPAVNKMPPLGVAAAIEVYPKFAAALLHFEKHSHIWVLAWIDRGERDLLQVVPRGASTPHGVFSVRSPARPNPIGITATRVVRQEGTTIEVERLDFLDGTPVIDIKPYFAARDMIFAARSDTIGKPASPAARRESLRAQAVQFHGEDCADLRLAVETVARHVEQLGAPEQWDVAAPVGRGCLIDALMGITRVSPGRNNLRFHEAAVIRLNGLDYAV